MIARFLLAAAALFAAGAAFGQGAGSAGAPAELFPQPDRPVAEIISPRWEGEAERDRKGEFAQVVRVLAIAPGESVADIGAGDGYYTTRLSRQVGPTGRVLAEDVQPDYLAMLGKRLRRERIANVTLVEGAPHDPRLPQRSVDAAILVHMYHEIAQPFGLLHNLAGALKPGGRVGIVDADAKPENHGTPPALLRCELAAVGYRETAFEPLRAGGYLAVFAAPAEPPPPSAIKPCRDAAR